MNDKNKIVDPDEFASELHHWLLLEGYRSPKVRRLWRIARREAGAELERIFETMVSEAKRAKREERAPTLWNLPARTSEWLVEHAQFTPPREVFVTLMYVGIAAFAIEFGKDLIFDSSADRGLSPESILNISGLDSGNAGRLASTSADSLKVPANRVDQWFTQEVANAMNRILDSDDFRTKLQTVVSECIESELANPRQVPEGGEKMATVGSSSTESSKFDNDHAEQSGVSDTEAFVSNSESH